MNENWVAFIKPGEQALAFRAYAVRVLEVLRETEWMGAVGATYGCPSCHVRRTGTTLRPTPETHAPDCALDALIRETEEMLK